MLTGQPNSAQTSAQRPWRPTQRLAARLCAATLCVLALQGCGEKADTAPSASTRAKSVSAEPVLLPDGALLALEFGDPQRLHDLLRQQGGLELLLVGKSYAASVAGLAGLPLRTIEEMDPAHPTRLLVGSSDGKIQWLAAVWLRDPNALLTIATAGREAPFRRRRDEQAARDRLLRSPVAAGPSLGVQGRALLIASDDDALERFAAYAVAEHAVGLAPRPGTLAVGLMRGDRLAARLQENAGQSVWGRLLGALWQGNTLGTQAEILLDAEAGALRLRATELAPAWASELQGCPRSDLDGLPESASAGVLLCETQARRVRAAEAAATGLFGEFSEPLVLLARARGASTVLGFEQGPVGFAAYGIVKTVDDKAAVSATQRSLGLLTEDAVSGKLGLAGFQMTASQAVIPRLGTVDRLHVQTQSGDLPPVFLELFQRPSELWLGLGTERGLALSLLRDRAAAPEAATPQVLAAAFFVLPNRSAADTPLVTNTPRFEADLTRHGDKLVVTARLPLVALRQLLDRPVASP